MIARAPGQSDAFAFVTDTGREVLERGIGFVHEIERISGHLHPSIEATARSQFLMGEYELGVFAAMKAVEVRVRDMGGYGNELTGVKLMNTAFGEAGALRDSEVDKGEANATRELFSGAYGVLRNPAGHREVDYDDSAEAAEAIQLASMLMRILDRVEVRTS